MADGRSYPLLSGLPANIQQALRPVWDQIHELTGDATKATRRNPLNFGGHAATNLKDPVAPQDAVTKAFGDTSYGGAAMQTALSVAGDFPLNVAGLKGVLTDPQLMGIRVVPDTDLTLPPVTTGKHHEVLTWQGKLYYFDDDTVNPGVWRILSAAASIVADTHANRISTTPALYDPTTLPLGLMFWETDRAALYYVRLDTSVTPNVHVWTLMMTRPLRSSAGLPGDLGVEDTGFLWFDQVAGYVARWSGAAWNYYAGSLYDTIANRPTDTLADRGFLFIAKDQGDHVWRKVKDGATDTWVLLEGVGGPMKDLIANRPASLTTTDVGFRFVATDQGNHQWRWSGTAWVLERGYGYPMPVTLSPDTKPTLTANDDGFLIYASDFGHVYRWNGVAWADEPRNNSSLTRDFIVWFVLAPGGAGWQACDGSTVTKSTSSGGTASVTVPDLITNKSVIRGHSVSGGTGGAATHTHSIDPPNTTSGNDSGTGTVVQSGAGTTVATHPHTHDTDIASFTSGTGSSYPPYYEALPYYRL